jgi:hypothetical protein
MIDYYETRSQPITRQMVWQAYQKVKSHKGSSGIDTMDWEALARDVRSHLYKLWNRLSSGSYFPQPVKEVAIKKKSGGVRKLGIPTLLDRIAQEVVRLHLERIVEHVVFDKWMEINHATKPFERYADDIVVHCKTERQAIYLLDKITHRLSVCKLEVQEAKTKIVNVRGSSDKKYKRSFDFLGFTIEPHYVRVKSGSCKILPRSVISKKSFSKVLDKFKHIHKRRKSLEELAKELNPVIRGVINYYCHIWSYHTQELWNQVNKRLQKWVKWEKGFYKMASIKWLKKKYEERPNLFAHWRLCIP